MRLLRVFPEQPRFRFMRLRFTAFAVACCIILASLGSLGLQGLNLGLDFTGGVLIEARAARPVDLASLRERLAGTVPGAVSLQTFGGANEVLIRVQSPGDGAASQDRTVNAIAAALPSDLEIRRSEFVGPQMSAELLRNGIVAAASAVLLIGVYVWFRFEWQFGLCAVLTTLHDVIATVGLFSLLRLEFNLTLIAALLTIAGYSINDTVVVFDRIRENTRLYKSMAFAGLIDLSINQTLSRTVLTSGTTLLAVLPLLAFGGPVLRDFALALTWGILVGTASTTFVAAPLLLYLSPLRQQAAAQPAPDPAGQAGAPPAPG